jgi:hypothetical protein
MIFTPYLSRFGNPNREPASSGESQATVADDGMPAHETVGDQKDDRLRHIGDKPDGG